ncbi:energy transducer TonB, partial [Vibrio xuii]
HKASSASQKEIDKSDQRIQLLKAEIEQLESDVKNLEVYRNHLTALVANQEQEMTSLHDQVEEVKTTRQGIVPLMYYMLDGLKHFVEQDIPVKSHQRAERISKLEALMTRAGVRDAEK